MLYGRSEDFYLLLLLGELRAKLLLLLRDGRLQLLHLTVLTQDFSALAMLTLFA